MKHTHNDVADGRSEESQFRNPKLEHLLSIERILYYASLVLSMYELLMHVETDYS